MALWFQVFKISRSPFYLFSPISIVYFLPSSCLLAFTERAKKDGVGNGNPVRYSCLENSMGRGAWQATVHSVAELDTSEQLIHTHTLISKPASFAAFPSQLSYFILSIAKNLDASFASLLRRPGPCYHMGLHCSHTLSLSSLIWICAKAPAGCLTSRRL